MSCVSCNWKVLVKEHLPLLMGAAVFFLIDRHIGCPVAWLIGRPCPTCGVTRAMICLLRLDFRGYWNHQPMAMPLCAALALLLHLRLLPEHSRRAVCWASTAVVAVNLLIWLIP